MAIETMTWLTGVVGPLPGALDIIDQRLLPAEAVRLELRTVDAVWDAIKTLAERGAPAIGCAAAYGVVDGAQGGLGGGAALEEIARKELEVGANLALLDFLGGERGDAQEDRPGGGDGAQL